MNDINRIIEKARRENLTQLALGTPGTAEITVSVHDEKTGEITDAVFRGKVAYKLENFMKCRPAMMYDNELETDDRLMTRVKALIMSNINLSTNLVFATQAEIAKILKVKDVNRIKKIMRKLRKGNFIRYQKGHGGYFMINPYMWCYGTAKHEVWLRYCWDNTAENEFVDKDSPKYITIDSKKIPENPRFVLRKHYTPNLANLLANNTKPDDI